MTTYYRVTKHLCSESDLDGWFEHFKSLKRPCMIMKHQGMYSLWIEGKEIRGEHCRYLYEEPKGEVVRVWKEEEK